MKTLHVMAVVAAAGLSMSGAATEPLVILPLGDSITQGAGAAGGYRAPLLTLLTNAGYRIQFVGSGTNNATAQLVAAGNAAHEGHGSYTTTDLHDNLDGNVAGPSANNGGFWLTGIAGVRPAVYPDVILLMAGVNDLGVNQLSPTQGLAGLQALLDKLVTMRPVARIVVSTLTPYIGTNYPNREANQQIFNAALPGIVSNRQAAGQRITLCDVRSGVPLTNAAALLGSDGVHPNQSGYDAIAPVWFEAIQRLPLTNSTVPWAGTAVTGYTLAWSDEFTGDALDTNRWDYRTDSKHWSTQLPANIGLSNGLLHLNLRKQTTNGMDYTGAGLISKPAFRYGYYEARLKTPPGRGWHTSFWMMRHDGSGGTSATNTTIELDCIENDSVSPLKYGVNTHRWNPAPHVSYSNKTVNTPALHADFHVFGCEFTPATIKYFFDGALVQTVDATQFPHGDLNIWLTSIASFLGSTTNVDDTLLPAAAQFDYARFFIQAPAYTGHPNRQASITFPGYTRGESLTEFPALLVLGPGVPGFDYGAFAATNGSDLSFWSADGATILPHEIARWDPNGDSHVWVRLPALTTGTTVLARWGDPQATNLPAASEVWSAGHRAVWHLAAGQAVDAAGLGHAAVSNSAAPATGLVADGMTLAGSNVIHVAHATDLDLPSNFEVQGWFKVAASNKPAVNNFLVLTCKQVDFNDRNWWLAIRSDGRLWWKSSPSLDVTNTTDLCDGAWHFVSAVHDGTAARLYLDGQLAAVDTSPGTAEVQVAPIYIGAEVAIRPFVGTLDEFRSSAQARSSNWVWATWLNIASNASFVSLGSFTNLPVPGYAGYAAQIPDAGQRGPLDDPDGDGHANLLEYVTAGSPTNSNAQSQLVVGLGGSGPALSFVRNTNATDAEIRVEGTSALADDATWAGLATNRGGSWGGATNIIESGTGTPVQVQVQDAGTNRFLRLKVVTP